MTKAFTDREAAFAVYHFRQGLERGSALAIIHPDFCIHAQAVDQTGKMARSSWSAALIEQCDKFGRILARLAGKFGVGPARGPNVCKNQVVQGLDPVLQRNHHQSDPSNDAGEFAPGSEEMRIARAVIAHRLSETSK